MKRFKRFLRTFFLTKWIYKKLYSLKMKKEKQQKRDNLQQNGVKTIHFLQELLDGERFFFDMGTLLGIVRENRLLGHDLDIDTAVYAESEEQVERIRTYLRQKGCCLKYTYYIENMGTVEDSFEINGIKFDVNYYKAENEQDVCYLMYTDETKVYVDGEMDVVKLTCNSVKNIQKREFHGKQINVPENAEMYLARRYGEDWRIPNTKWIYWKGPSTSPTQYVGKQISY